MYSKLVPFVVLGFSATWMGAEQVVGQVASATAEAATSPSWDKTVEMLIKVLGPLVVLAWYMYQEKSVSEPRREKAQQDEREKLQKLNEARIDKLVESMQSQSTGWASAIRDQAASFAASMARMADVHEKMIVNCYHRGGSAGTMPDVARTPG